MNMDASEIEALGKVIAKELRRAEIEDPLLNTDDVAALINCEPRSVTEHFAHSPTFPKAIHLDTGTGKGKSRPRWRRSAILTWISAHEYESPKAKIGRPRNKVES
jgi:predicted DNA-binding transcriptional regulator AlpA